MAAPDDTLRRIDALVTVALRIAGAAPSGRIVLARLAEATRPEWIPAGWRDSVWPQLEAAARAATEPVPFDEVERLLRDAWGARPTDELDELDPDPVAVTPGAQVHRGVLDGEPVAVKVLRPGLAASVRQDLALLEGLAAPLSAAFPQLDATALLREARERVLDELDLEHEATTQRRVYRALRRHPFLSVPAPVTRLAGDSVLVSAWAEGTPLRDLQGSRADAAAARLLAFVLGGIREGVIHCDPDPADVLVGEDGRLVVLDFGAVAVVDAERASAAGALVEAFAADDADGLGAALERLGALPAERGPDALALSRHVLGELAGGTPARLDVAAVVELGRRLAARQADALALAGAGRVAPADLWPLRGIGALFATIARVGATGDWLELTRRALRDGWSAEAGDA